MIKFIKEVENKLACYIQVDHLTYFFYTRISHIKKPVRVEFRHVLRIVLWFRCGVWLLII